MDEVVLTVDGATAYPEGDRGRNRRRVPPAVTAGALFAVALIALLVASAIKGKRIPGVAQSVPIPGPPTAGQCLESAPVVGTDPHPFPVRTFDPALLVPCTEKHTLEVVLVVPDQMSALDSASQQSPDGEIDPALGRLTEQCFLATNRYLGFGDELPATPGQWQLVFPRVNSLLLRPSDLQQRVGQRWAGCVLTGYEPILGENSYPEPRAMSVSMVQAGVGGPATDLVTWCQAAAPHESPEYSKTIDCDQPHRSELIGSFYPLTKADVRTGEQLARTCDTFAHKLVGTALPPDVLRTTALRDGGTVGGPDGDEFAVWSCIVHTTGSRTLSGSLVGLNGRPIPWTP